MKRKFLRIGIVYGLAGLIFLLVLAALSGQLPISHAQSPHPAASLKLTDTSNGSVFISQTKRPAALQPISMNHVITTVTILVDDYMPQRPIACERQAHSYNRAGGNRGLVGNPIPTWGQGIITMTLKSGQTWGGLWTNLNHCLEEREAINFAALLPAQILPPYQSQIAGITAEIITATPGAQFKVELKEDSSQIRWRKSITLTGGPQVFSSDLPPLSDIRELVWLLDQASGGNYVVVDRVALTATTQITDTALASFVWSYGQLLENWNPESGLVRDKAKDSSGAFDAIQATGSLAAATAQAAQLGVIEQAEAIQIVEKISDTLLTKVPRYHGEVGLLPHWVKVTPSGVLTIVTGTEWSSIDTVIAAIGLLEAQEALSLDTSGTVSLLQMIDWATLRLPTGISHGYDNDRELIPYTWHEFGGEFWLIALAFAAATGEIPPIDHTAPPTANGSGFIDEMAWLFFPPPEIDYWGTNWPAYRGIAAQKQIDYPCQKYPTSCPCRLGLFGLSAAEVPDPSMGTYDAFGVGGRFGANDSHNGSPVAVPHYAALIASLRPTEAIRMWTWLINQGPVSPLNNVESLMFQTGASCEASEMTWNQLKGSWNLALQILGWGRYLAQRAGQTPILWQAMDNNQFLRAGYLRLAPPGVGLGPDHQTQQTYFGQTIEYTYTLTNTGPTTDSFTLRLSSSQDGAPKDGGDILIAADHLTGTNLLSLSNIGPQMTATFILSLTAPAATTLTNIIITARITATSQLSPTIQDTIVNTTTVVPWSTYLPLVAKCWSLAPTKPILWLDGRTDGDGLIWTYFFDTEKFFPKTISVRH